MQSERETCKHPDGDLIWVLMRKDELAEPTAPPWPWRMEQCDGSVALFRGERLVARMEPRAFENMGDVEKMAQGMSDALNLWYNSEERG